MIYRGRRGGRVARRCNLEDKNLGEDGATNREGSLILRGGAIFSSGKGRVVSQAGILTVRGETNLRSREWQVLLAKRCGARAVLSQRDTDFYAGRRQF